MAEGGILPGHWYYNTESGELTHGNNFENLGNNLFGGLGWHELNISGNATEAQAAAEAKKEFPTGTAPTTSLTKGIVNSTPLAGLAAFLADITSRNLWVRVTKVVVGVALIIVGVVQLTGAPAVAADIAKNAI